METPSLRYLKELSNGNKDFEMKIFNLLLEEFPTEFSIYQNAIRVENYYWASEIVHKIKNKIALFEMREALALAEKHEVALLSGNLKYELDFQEIITEILKFIPENNE